MDDAKRTAIEEAVKGLEAALEDAGVNEDTDDDDLIEAAQDTLDAAVKLVGMKVAGPWYPVLRLAAKEVRTLGRKIRKKR